MEGCPNTPGVNYRMALWALNRPNGLIDTNELRLASNSRLAVCAIILQLST
ncbi:hypothetical protein [Spirosoma sp. KNUC1025]|uniref:hypothetical protein n=1 Tax=Spirosoma sp. KNUC1025 TaxID=2894082 RepID=UPI00386B08AC|nr:hypothetical protein LN737_13940 [Spirosoma sp. KNUC1025]